jgi:hypothetical protein
MPNEWGDEAVNEWGDARATPAPPAASRSGSNRWLQKAGEGLVPGYNRLVALGSAATDPLLGIGQGEGFGQRYDRNLRAEQAQSAETQREHPYVAPLLQAAGAAPLMTILPGAAPAATLLGRVASGAASTAPIGGAYAVGDAPADATPDEIAKRGLGGALVAGGVGGAIPLVGAAAGPLARKLGRTAIEQGRKALSGVGSPLSARKPIPEPAVQEALDTGAIRPFGTVAGTAGRLEASAERLGVEYGGILEELAARGVTGPNAVALAKQIRARAQEAAKTSLGSSRPGTLSDVADELLEKVGGAAPKAGHGHHGKAAEPEGLVDAYGRPVASPPPAPREPRLGLMQSEEIKRGLQQEARREYDKITRQYTTAGETKKELAALMREAIETEVQAQAGKAPAAAAAFQPVKAKLANTLEALRHAEEGAARASRRKPVSLTSTIAGSAAGAATGSPAVGLGSALLHGIADARLASTLAAAANSGAKGLSGAALPAASRTALRSTVPGGQDPLLRALLEALSGRRLGVAPVAAEGEGP